MRAHDDQTPAPCTTGPTESEDAGALLEFAKVAREMSQERTARQAVIESERRFRLLVQGVVDDEILMADPDGIVSDWNAGAQRIKGDTSQDMMGQPISRFYTPEDKAADNPFRALEIAAPQGRREA